MPTPGDSIYTNSMLGRQVELLWSIENLLMRLLGWDPENPPCGIPNRIKTRWCGFPEEHTGSHKYTLDEDPYGEDAR